MYHSTSLLLFILYRQKTHHAFVHPLMVFSATIWCSCVIELFRIYPLHSIWDWWKLLIVNWVNIFNAIKNKVLTYFSHRYINHFISHQKPTYWMSLVKFVIPNHLIIVRWKGVVTSKVQHNMEFFLRTWWVFQTLQVLSTWKVIFKNSSSWAYATRQGQLKPRLQKFFKNSWNFTTIG